MPPPPPALKEPFLAGVAGALLALTGAAMLVSVGGCEDTADAPCGERAHAAAGGALLGAGAVAAGIAGYVTFTRWKSGAASGAGFSLALRF